MEGGGKDGCVEMNVLCWEVSQMVPNCVGSSSISGTVPEAVPKTRMKDLFVGIMFAFLYFLYYPEVVIEILVNNLNCLDKV